MSGSLFDPHWTQAELEPMTHYRSLSVLAIISLVFGLFSFLFLIHWGFFFMPLLAALLASLGLIQIRRSSGTLFGHWFAYFGLFLAIMFISAKFSMDRTWDVILVKQAKQFAPLVFETLKNDDIPGYLQLKSPRWNRKIHSSLDAHWESLAKNSFATAPIKKLTEDPLIRTLMALGNQAKITYFKTDSVQARESELVTLIYAVTYPADSGPETFFFKISLQRREDEWETQGKFRERAGWRVIDLNGPVLPEYFGGKS